MMMLLWGVLDTCGDTLHNLEVVLIPVRRVGAVGA